MLCIVKGPRLRLSVSVYGEAMMNKAVNTKKDFICVQSPTSPLASKIKETLISKTQAELINETRTEYSI